MPAGWIIFRAVEFVAVLANLIVCGVATQAFRETRKRGLLLLAVGGAIGAVASVMPELRGFQPSWLAWNFEMLTRVVSAVLWVVGTSLLIRDYLSLVRAGSPPPASANLDPAAAPGNTAAAGGPPSMR